MNNNKEIKYPLKSKRYKGVFQRKGGKWFYRIKKNINNKTYIYQQSGFETDELAFVARNDMLKIYQNLTERQMENLKYEKTTFGEVFCDFIKNCESETSKKKYQDLYNAHLKKWEDRNIDSITNETIDVLLLKLSMTIQNNGKPYSPHYQASIRKLIKKVFKYAYQVVLCSSYEVGQNLYTQPYKLRVLSLFSGIGAPEQALKNLGIDYELVNFCEIDKKASKAYCLFHKEEQSYKEFSSKNLNDITKIDNDTLSKQIPHIDLMFFGFPCTDISKLGKQAGLSKGLPTQWDLNFLKDLELTRSGLFYEAMRIAAEKMPKIMIAENVGALIGEKFRKDFDHMMKLAETLCYTIGYKTYYTKLNSKDFGLPQSRPRVFMIMIRNDLDIEYKFPEPTPLKVKAKDWFETEVDEEYYVKPEKWEKMNNYNSHKPQTKENDYIGCITTKWGSISNSGQKFIRVGDRYRIMTSEELMKFQGFPPEYGTLLRQNGFSKNQVGKLVGNSISVPVMEAIIKSLINCM